MNASTVSPLLPFYLGTSGDHKQRTLEFILSNDDMWLEREHDYIQWLFPISETSEHNPQAPLIDAEVIAAFKQDERLRLSQRRAFARMAQFYGFTVIEDEDEHGKPEIFLSRAPHFERSKTRWISANNHNYKRITRMLKSLSLLSSPHHAQGLGNALALLGREFGGRMGVQTLAIWQASAFGRARPVT